MFSPQRALRVLRAGVVVGVALAVGVPGSAATATPAPGAPSTSPPELASQAPTVEITLVTGDTVAVGRLANGNYTATPRASASRPGEAPVAFQTLTTPEGDLYVIPSDAGAAIASGRVDRELFNVARLASEGHTGSRALPVIVQYGAAQAGARASKQADALPATSDVRSLESIDAAGVNLTVDERARFWATVRGPGAGARALSVGVERLWLDRRVKAVLDHSVRQVGAPTAWDAGLDGAGVSVAVLDTGIDARHPDLAGKVTEARSFVPEESVQDGFGHGTHVASTVSGSGAAADGRYRGVAPGADLLIGKVLDNTGFGQTSWIIDGMEWAAGTGATVINMSLGGDATDGSDPLSQAVERLTEQTGTLFVISAGNAGSGRGTITAPGSAPSALTVGAVNREDQLADFSSRGPVVRSYAVKPELTAPGVGIVAARAEGTSMGAPVDDRYTASDGTSMAAPHVTGAVAILAQQHPDWTAGQLKDALVGSAVPHASLTTYEQGAGRLDIGRAISRKLTASPSVVDLGKLEQQATDPVSRVVTVTNHEDTPAEVNLESTLRGPQGAPVDALVVEPANLVIPANGTARATVTFTPRPGAEGGYWGSVRGVDAASGAEVLRVAFGAYQSPPGHTLRLISKPPAGWPSAVLNENSAWVLVRVDAPQDPIFVGRGDGPANPTVDVYVPDGVYSASVSFRHFQPHTGDYTLTQLVDPQIVVRGADTEVVVDGTGAVPIQLRTPRPSELVDVHQGLVRGTTYGGAYDSAWLHGDDDHGRTTVQVTPTEKVTVGTARFITAVEAVQAQADLRVLGRGAPVLDPSWASRQFQEPKLDVDRQVGVVDVGSGSEAEIARANVRGRLVLLTRPWRETYAINLSNSSASAILARLRDRGALGALVALDEAAAGWCGPYITGTGGSQCASRVELPVLRIGPGEARVLRAYLARHRSVSARLTTKSTSTYDYRLRFDEPTVSDGMYRIGNRELHEVRSEYRASDPRDLRRYSGTMGLEGAYRNTASWRGVPAVQSSYVGPVTEKMLFWTQQASTRRVDRDSEDWGLRALSDYTVDTFRTTGRSEQVWGTPGGVGAYRVEPEIMNGELASFVPWIDGCVLCRDGEGRAVLSPLQTFGDGTQHGDNYLWYPVFHPDRIEARLYRDGVELPTQNEVVWDLGQYPEPADYRFTHKVVPYGYAEGPTEVETTWWYRSQEPDRDESIRGFECYGQANADPASRSCRVERALLLSMDLEPATTLDRSGVVSRHIEFPLHVYRQHGAPRGSAVDVRVQVSYDGGRSWRSAKVDRESGTEFTVRIAHERAAKVSLRATAWDRDGNRVEQTLRDAYQVGARR